MLKLLLILSAALFILSLFLPAIVYNQISIVSSAVDPAGFPDPGKVTQQGYEILQVGWTGALVLMFAWYANVFGPISFLFVCAKRYKTAVVLSLIAFFLALQSFSFSAYPQDEAGITTWHVDHLSIGFYVWAASFVLLFLYSYISLRTAPPSPNK